MRISVGLHARELGPNVDGLIFRVTKKKALLGREAVGVLCGCLAMQRFLESGVGEFHAAKVRDATPLDQLPVFMQALLDFIPIELFNNAFAAFLKTLQVFRRPPILKIAARIELRALIVEAVSDFVADNRPDAAIVVRIVTLGIVERRLQYSGRENDFVKLRVVVGVDSGRSFAPLAAVNRFPNLSQVATVFKLAGTKHVHL